MKKQFFSILFVCFNLLFAFAQQTIVKGVVKDMLTDQPILGVMVSIEGTQLSTYTNELGTFEFSSALPLGDQILLLRKTNYLNARYPIIVSEGQTLNIQDLMMSLDDSDDDLFTITLSDDELNDDTSGADNISGLLSASQDIFQRAAAFEFSQSFFRVRGLNSENGNVLMNGIEMNKCLTADPNGVTGED